MVSQIVKLGRNQQCLLKCLWMSDKNYTYCDATCFIRCVIQLNISVEISNVCGDACFTRVIYLVLQIALEDVSYS